jgi:nucleoid-associated protein YgaU
MKMARDPRPAAKDPEDTMAADKTTPAAAAAANNPYTQIHVVQSGDTLSKIAQKYYGDASLYPKIFEANRDQLSDPNRISPGQKLRIP